MHVINFSHKPTNINRTKQLESFTDQNPNSYHTVLILLLLQTIIWSFCYGQSRKSNPLVSLAQKQTTHFQRTQTEKYYVRMVVC